LVVVIKRPNILCRIERRKGLLDKEKKKRGATKTPEQLEEERENENSCVKRGKGEHFPFKEREKKGTLLRARRSEVGRVDSKKEGEGGTGKKEGGIDGGEEGERAASEGDGMF